MKIFMRIKSDKFYSLKLFGITIYKKYFDYKKNERTQIFLAGLITTLKISLEYGSHIEKTIKFAGIPVVKIYEINDIIKTFFCGICLHQTSKINVFLKKYRKYFTKDFDDIYILNANSGEIYLFLAHIFGTYAKKNGSKKPLLVATKDYHIPIIKVLCPEIPYIFLKNAAGTLKSKVFSSKVHRFYMIFEHPYFLKVESKIKNHSSPNCHYFKSILERCKINKKEIISRKVKIDKLTRKSMLEKVFKTGLAINNFILLAPEAKSCKLLDDNFWMRTISELKKQGYDIFLNIACNKVNLKNTGCKTCFLSYAEVFALAKRAKKIIALRSGLTDFLVSCGTPMDVLYTGFPKRPLFGEMSAEDVLSGFNLSELPNFNGKLIKEFNMEQLSTQEYLDENIKY